MMLPMCKLNKLVLSRDRYCNADISEIDTDIMIAIDFFYILFGDTTEELIFAFS